MRRLVFVGLIALGVATVGAEIPKDRTELRVVGLDPNQNPYAVEVVDQGTPTVLGYLAVDDQGRGTLVFEGDLDYPVVTIRPAP